MPIKLLRKGLPVIGYAKIGFPTEKSDPVFKGAPVKLDHIELTGRSRDEHNQLIPDGLLLQHLVESEEIPTCGGCPRSAELGFPNGLPTRLPIFLPYNDLELSFPNDLTLFRGGTVFCTGDGEQAKRRELKGERKPSGRNSKAIPIFGDFKPHAPCGPTCADFKSRRCKPYGRLRFVLGCQQSVGGVFEFRTTSWNSIANLVESLEAIQVATGGIVEWIPLFFDISPQKVQPADGRPASQAMIARVTFPGTPNQLLQAVEKRLEIQAPTLGKIRQLEASIQRTVEIDPEDVREFDPDGPEEGRAELQTEEPEAPVDVDQAAAAEAEQRGQEEMDQRTDGPADQADLDFEGSDPAPADATASAPPAEEGQLSPAQRKAVIQEAKRRAHQLGFEDEDAGSTVLREVLRARHFESLDQVPPYGIQELVAAIRAHEVGQAA